MFSDKFLVRKVRNPYTHSALEVRSSEDFTVSVTWKWITKVD